MVSEFDRRRHLVVSALNDMRRVRVVEPSGAFYVMPDISEFGSTSGEFCLDLLAQTGVAIVPGTAFGSFGEGLVRVSYANSYENLEKAMQRIAGFLA